MKNNIIASCIFTFEKLEIKKDFSRLLKLTLKTVLPQSFREYTVRLSYNEVPMQTKIADMKARIEEVKSDKQNDLFPTEGAKKTQIKNITADIKELEEELAENIRTTKVLEFEATIDKLEYKDGDTIVTMQIFKEVINELNDVASILQNYKVELIRE